MSVLVLLANENRSYEGLKDIGMKVATPYLLCRERMPSDDVKHKVFTFELQGLYPDNNKIMEFARTKKGIIIMLHVSEIYNNINKIKQITKILSDIPILIWIDGIVYAESLLLKQFVNDNCRIYMKNFFIESDELNYDWFITQINNIKSKNDDTTSKHDIITDKQFIQQFISQTLPMDLWNHYGRLRVVFLAIKIFGYNDSININGQLCTKWKLYKKSINHEKLWHYTLTRFWVTLINQLIQSYPDFEFKSIWNKHTIIQKGMLHKEYYTNELLFTDNARNNWVLPDKKKL